LLLRSKRNIGVDVQCSVLDGFARHIPRGTRVFESELIAVCQTIITLRRVKLLRPMQFGVNLFATWELVKIARILASELDSAGSIPVSRSIFLHSRIPGTPGLTKSNWSKFSIPQTP
jgi:hypothetical protein